MNHRDDTSAPVLQKTCGGSCGRTLPATEEYFCRRNRTSPAFIAQCRKCRQAARPSRAALRLAGHVPHGEIADTVRQIRQAVSAIDLREKDTQLRRRLLHVVREASGLKREARESMLRWFGRELLA